MSAPTQCRLLIDPPCSGAWNMAVDEVLLEWAAEEGCCAWRFYGWSEPTLSLGYFQSYRDRLTHAPSLDCPAVRRLTGGGAILHDAELTYSFAVPGGHHLAIPGTIPGGTDSLSARAASTLAEKPPVPPGRDLLYQAVHAGLIAALAEYRIAAAFCGEPGRRPPQEEPFLCFQRRTPGDVLLGGSKIAGSAQRRRRGAVLQHGSLLLRRSPAAPELPGLEELAQRVPAPDELAEVWLAKLAEGLRLRWRRESMPASRRQQVVMLSQARYASAQWTRNRALPPR